MNEKLNEALNEIRDEHISEASKRPRSVIFRRVGVIAAILVVAIVIGVVGNPLAISAKAVSVATYEKTNIPDLHEHIQSANEQLRGFFKSSMVQILTDETGANQAFSPVNLYLAMSAAAELTGGDEQLLTLLDSPNLSELRSQAYHVWNSCYQNKNDKSLLASSLWLDNALTYNQEVMDTLAKTYYTSVYQGDLGSSGVDRAITQWLNQQTNNLLSDNTGNVQLPDNAVLAFYSTIYFQVKWDKEFKKSNNTEGVFHCPDGDETVTFMNGQRDANYYWGSDFSAAAINLKNGGKMWLILPDEGKTPNDLLQSGAFLDALFPEDGFLQEGENYKHMKVNLSLPKFDIRCSEKLEEDLQALGVTNIFDPDSRCLNHAVNSMFSCYVDEINQATRVTVDEEGITAASYVEIIGAGNAAPPSGEEVDLVLDRPFLFVVVNYLGLPLFAGTVNHP